MIDIEQYNPPISDDFYLNIEKITITKVDIIQIPEWVYLCKNVKYINVADNCITDLIPIHDCKQLMTLNISNNPIESLFGITTCVSLKELWIHNTNISTLGYLPFGFDGEISICGSNLTKEYMDIFMLDNPNVIVYD